MDPGPSWGRNVKNSHRPFQGSWTVGKENDICGRLQFVLQDSFFPLSVVVWLLLCIWASDNPEKKDPGWSCSSHFELLG